MIEIRNLEFQGNPAARLNKIKTAPGSLTSHRNSMRPMRNRKAKGTNKHYSGGSADADASSGSSKDEISASFVSM
jgi:hypothetical protein